MVKIGAIIQTRMGSTRLPGKVLIKLQDRTVIENVVMKAQQYREMSKDELEGRLEELERHLFDLRSQAVTEKLENSKSIINVKRDIARVKTIMRESK